MNNFDFYNPVTVHFGKGQINKIRSAIPIDAKVMIVFGGGSIKKNGVYDQVRSALSDHSVVEFAGVQPNPQYETLMDAVKLARSEEVTYLLAVGGGSVIDGTKFISAAIKHPTDPWDILAKREPINDTIDYGCILTLPATGSEMNSFSVVSNGEDKLGFGGDPRLYAKFAVLDPETTYSLPEKQLGNGIVDAFVHVCEQYLTKDINSAVQDRFSEGILLTLIENAPRIIELKEDYDSRANLMWAATNALNGIVGVGVVHDWATHMIGHELTALYKIDHARTLAVILPSLLRSQKEHKKDKLLQFAKRVWNIDGGSPEQRIEKAILMTEDFFNSVGVPTKLKTYGISKDDFHKIVTSVKKHHPYSLGENKAIDEKVIYEILEGAL